MMAKSKNKGEQAEIDLEFVLWKTIETRAGGKLDLKQSDRDQTNSTGL